MSKWMRDGRPTKSQSNSVAEERKKAMARTKQL